VSHALRLLPLFGMVDPSVSQRAGQHDQARRSAKTADNRDSYRHVVVIKRTHRPLIAKGGDGERARLLAPAHCDRRSKQQRDEAEEEESGPTGR